MNRLLLIPASCCLLAFIALATMLHGANSGAKIETVSPVKVETALTTQESRLSLEESEQKLTKLTEEYLQPWREMANSPQHLYSRAGPRPLPPVLVKVNMPTVTTSANENLLLASIDISVGGKSAHRIPCVVERATQQIRLFANGEWLSAAEWIKNAPAVLFLSSR